MIALPKSPAGFPMAPSQEQWDAFTPQGQAEVLAALPSEVTDAEMAPPEGDRHFRAKVRALGALRSHFTRQRRRVYVAAELPVYYPNAPRFAPDLLVVLDAADEERDKWVVSAERKGLDWVLEVHVGGDRKKDAETNVLRYAALGIPEYFLYYRAREQLKAFRLPSPDARSYVPIVPQRGLYPSSVLGLDVQVEQGRLRFFEGTAMLLESEELIGRLERMVEQLEQRAAEEARLRTEEARLREAAERDLAVAKEELARLRSK